MSEKILNEFVAEMTSLLQGGAQFVGAQMPLVCREILTYGLITSLFWIVVSVAVFYGLYRFWTHVLVITDLFNMNDLGDLFIFWMLVLVSIIAPTVGLLCNLNTLVKVLVMPRLYLLKYFADLV